MTDHAQTSSHVPAPISRAAFARLSGRARSTVTEACQGPLAAACLPGGRIDRAHPAAQDYLASRGVLVAKRAPSNVVGPDAFAALLSLDREAVRDAYRGPCAAARVGDIEIDIAHPSVLDLAASRPFPRGPDGFVHDDAWPAGILAPAMLDDDTIDLDHPRARLWLARLDCVVPTDATVAELAA